jgi:phosphoribosylaminoimidazole-succinocarboxamide synthase
MMKTVYEGKAKIVREQENQQEVAIFFKDEATAFDGTKKDTIPQKGYYNAQITCLIFSYLTDKGILTHFIRELDARTILVKKLQIIPIEVVVRNIATGSLVKRIGLTEGEKLIPPVVEFYYKNDPLHDPLINEDHARVLRLATSEELSELRKKALEINNLLTPLLDRADLMLVDFKLEFGRYDGQILLGDEISPDTCRFWDKTTRQKLDKDRFRQDLGGVIEAYAEVYDRLSKIMNQESGARSQESGVILNSEF